MFCRKAKQGRRSYICIKVTNTYSKIEVWWWLNPRLNLFHCYCFDDEVLHVIADVPKTRSQNEFPPIPRFPKPLKKLSTTIHQETRRYSDWLSATETPPNPSELVSPTQCCYTKRVQAVRSEPICEDPQATQTLQSLFGRPATKSFCPPAPNNELTNYHDAKLYWVEPSSPQAFLIFLNHVTPNQYCHVWCDRMRMREKMWRRRRCCEHALQLWRWCCKREP